MPLSTVGVRSLFIDDFALADLAEGTVHYVPGQHVITHKYPGGARTFQVMGQDYDLIRISALLFGNLATDLAATLKVFVTDGRKHTIRWNNEQADVVFKSVTFEQQSKFMIYYTIEAYVMQDADVLAVIGGTPIVQNNIAAAGAL